MPGYGGTRDWALWVEVRRGGGSGFISHLELYGRGHLYATEANAQRGLERLVKSGGLIPYPDGSRRTPGMGLRVTVDRVPR